MVRVGLVKPSSLGNFSTLFHNFGGAAEERFETKKYPKLPVVSARDGTEADGPTPPPEQHRSPAERYLSGWIAIWVRAKK